MLDIAGQTAGPNWLIFLREPMGIPGITIRNTFFQNKKIEVRIFYFI